MHHAADIGIEVVALTDHDTMAGVPEADVAAGQLGIELIPAVELTTHWQTNGWAGGVDLLAYFVQRADPGFQSLLEGAQTDLRARVSATCDHLTAAGYPVTFDEVLTQNPRHPGGAALVDALVEKGYTPTFDDGLELFFDAWKGVPPGALTIEDAIHAVHAAGGVAVLAHPVRVRLHDGLLTAEDIAPLADAGLDGIEVSHPTADAETREYFRRVALTLDLLESGGSDEHGRNGAFTRMGAQPVTFEMVDALQRQAGAWRVNTGVG
jgi:predicted metal-dependent phosphoesterase TrpH